MINKVGLGINVNGIVPNFRAEVPEETTKAAAPDFKPVNKGLEALAAYNEAIVKKSVSNEKLNIEPLTPIIIYPVDIDKLEGEKIYTSDGKLQSIIRRDEYTYTIFTPDKENDGKFALIEVFSKETGTFPIKRQSNHVYGNTSYVNIEEINPQTGDTIKSTSYDDGKIESISKMYDTPDGKTIHVSYDYSNKGYYADITYKNNKGREICAYFNDDKQLESVSETRVVNGVETETGVYFLNGAPYRISKKREIIIPNNIGKENLAELKPAEYFKKIENIKEIEGEKTYYSNGALESNTFDSESGKTVAHFLPDGSCDKINSDNKEITFEKNCETIKEILDDGKIKETVLFKDGDYSVEISDEKTYKKAYFYKNNKPSQYEEGSLENGEKHSTKWLSFNEQGMLDYT